MTDKIDVHPKRKAPTPEQIVAEQKRLAETGRRLKTATALAPASAPLPDAPGPTANVPAVAKTSAPAVPDTRTPKQRYLDDVAPTTSIVGRMIKFDGKNGGFITPDDDEPVSDAVTFLALCDQTLIGWIRFHNDGETPPDRVCGQFYDDFRMPPRETLGDLDPSQWSEGLSGKPEDPWKHQMCLVLQNTETRELATFVTTSPTGRRAVGNLLRHFDRMQRTNPGEVPIVRLKAGGFNHRDERIGWVPVPTFTVVGRAPREDAASPDASPPDTSPGGDMGGDQIPF